MADEEQLKSFNQSVEATRREMLDVAFSRLREIEAQLRAFNRYTLLNEPTMPRLLAEDVRKAREAFEGLAV